MKQYDISGMSCAACSARVEKAVTALEGVTSCSVSLLTNSMTVEGDISEDEIIKAVTDAGYGAKPKGQSSPAPDNLEDTETPRLKKRLWLSLVFLAVLMYFSMGHSMWGWPVPSFIHGNHILLAILQMVLTAVVMVINRAFFINGFKGLAHRSPNMDTLVALGSSAAFVYSAGRLVAMLANPSMAEHYAHDLYFESAAMIVSLITLGKMLEARSKGKTTDALKGLMNLAPKTATLIVDGEEVTVSAESISRGDTFAVRPGESIPADGVIISGSTSVNESAITGESIPADKAEGDNVSAATINLSGYIQCKATKVGEDTTLAQIIKLISDAAATKAPIAKIADKVSGVFVPVVMSLALLTAIIWLLCGQTVGYAVARGISVLVISCPCALGLATPVAIMVGSGVGAKHGILFKTAASLEALGKVSAVVLDKTGTITKGEPEVTDIVVSEAAEEAQLIETAYALEYKSEHPLAKAIVSFCKEKNISLCDAENFKIHPGNGISASIGGLSAYGGKLSYVAESAPIPQALEAKASELAQAGKTPLFFILDGKALGIIAVADTPKADSPEAIAQLHAMGIDTVMLTGDNRNTAEAIGKEAGVDRIIADVLPSQKEAVIREIKSRERVAMVGDGINDAPALTTADIGIAIGAGTDIAIDSADVVLMNSSLSDVAAAIRLGRATLKNIKENLFWAFIYNIIGIPLAAGVYIPIFGWELDPMFGAAAMSLSSFCVVTNALRLNFKDIRNPKYDKKKKHKIKEITKMEKILKIEGMMCPHCEARVKNTLEAIEGVTEAIVSHETGTATVVSDREIATEVLKGAVEAQGYKVV